MKKVGKQSYTFSKVYVGDTGVTVGPKEHTGPINDYFDFAYDDLYCGQKTWDKAEIQLLKDSIRYCLNKNNLGINDIDAYFGGDLNNQITCANYTLRDYDVPFVGIFGACSTSMEGIIVGGMFLEAGFGKNVLVGTSSHNATSEKQYRYPTEYGGQKPISVTSTVTGAGVALLTTNKTNIKVTKATLGKVVDAKFSDPFDLGRAMVPAAYSTIKQHFLDFNLQPSDYDLIVTGDLSYYGKEMLINMFQEDNIDMTHNYNDCGLIIYDRENQDVLAGGSGCACCATVTYSYLFERLKAKSYKRILVVATGALHNPVILAQKETIPGIAYAVSFERVGD
ncbi:MAG TPA: stage V sporulation protein AD [Acholeplasmataceae bacterium]|nr:stage V sporulation protein AD [Acholeplasmataceae bacterium]